MFGDIIEKNQADEDTSHKNCGNCACSDDRLKLVGTIYCVKKNGERLKGYFCFDWEKKLNT